MLQGKKGGIKKREREMCHKWAVTPSQIKPSLSRVPTCVSSTLDISSPLHPDYMMHVY
jgi:hypothetical protein